MIFGRYFDQSFKLKIKFLEISYLEVVCCIAGVCEADLMQTGLAPLNPSTF